MQFWQVDEDAFQCMVTEEDFEAVGATITDIITDRDKMSAVLFAVLREAEHEIGYSAGRGVMAAFKPASNGAVIVTVCACNDDGDCASRLQEISSMTNYNFEDIVTDTFLEDELIFRFKSFKDLERYARAFPFDMAVNNALYKDEQDDIYYLCLVVDNMDSEDKDSLCFFTLEYAEQCSHWDNFHSYCDEHFTCLIKSNALEKLVEFAV